LWLTTLPLETEAAGDAKCHTLTINRIISHKPKENGGGPYLASCYLDSDKSRLYVAKIYDALEYQLADAGDNGRDCMYLADKDYAREAAAYQSIPQHFPGDIVPRYFGSWTFFLQTVSGAAARTRPVRMILLEHIQGYTMLDAIVRAIPDNMKWPRKVDYSLLPPEEERLEILGRVVEVEVALWWCAGVRHNDVSPRNVMISRTSDNSLRVVLIDFNLAHVDGYFERGQQSLTRRETDSLPISPIERYWPGSDFTSRCEFAGWIPESWHENSDVGNAKALEWLVFRWKGSPKYQRLSEDFFDDEMNEAFRDFVQRYLALLKLEQARKDKDSSA
jgi:serine/threonine protein kinase